MSLKRAVVDDRCKSCQARPASFRYRGRVRRDRDHDLCQQCWRALMNRSKALAMRGIRLPLAA